MNDHISAGKIILYGGLDAVSQIMCQPQCEILVHIQVELDKAGSSALPGSQIMKAKRFGM